MIGPQSGLTAEQEIKKMKMFEELDVLMTVAVVYGTRPDKEIKRIHTYIGDSRLCGYSN